MAATSLGFGYTLYPWMFSNVHSSLNVGHTDVIPQQMQWWTFSTKNQDIKFVPYVFFFRNENTTIIMINNNNKLLLFYKIIITTAQSLMIP